MSQSQPLTLRIKPIWRDQDALGHVNNAVYSTWLENAREAYWTAFAGAYDLFPFMLARTEIDFRAAATWRDHVVVSVWVSKIGNSSFEFSYSIDGDKPAAPKPASTHRDLKYGEGGTHFADAKTVLVMYDFAEKKTVPIDKAMRKRMEEFERVQKPPA